MRAVNVSRSLGQGSTGDSLHSERFQSRAGRHDIGNGVLGSDFVKADDFRWHAMDPPLGLGDPAKDGEAALLHPFPEGALLDQGHDLGMVPSMGMTMMILMIVGMMVMPVRPMMRMIVVVVVMMMVTGLRSLVSIMPFDQKAPPGDSTAVGPLESAGGERDRQRGEGVLKDFLGHTEVA